MYVWYWCFPNIILSQYHKLSKTWLVLSLSHLFLVKFNLSWIWKTTLRFNWHASDKFLWTRTPREQNWDLRQIYRDANDNNRTIQKPFLFYILFSVCFRRRGVFSVLSLSRECTHFVCSLFRFVQWLSVKIVKYLIDNFLR